MAIFQPYKDIPKGTKYIQSHLKLDVMQFMDSKLQIMALAIQDKKDLVYLPKGVTSVEQGRSKTMVNLYNVNKELIGTVNQDTSALLLKNEPKKMSAHKRKND